MRTELAPSRLGAKMHEVVGALRLDLRGRTVLTEAATGPYVVTPLIAAMAGARVVALGRDSSYGTAREALDGTTREMERTGRTDLDIELVDRLTPALLAEADVITNSGHLRPLDRDKLQHARDDLVLPLMYEAWEWRVGDLDLDYARERGFRVGATNERHPLIDVFGYLGDMALRQIFDAGLCAHGRRYVLVCNNDFGPYIARTLSAVCAGLAVVAPDEQRSHYEGLPVTFVGGFPDAEVPAEFRDAEALVLAAYPFDQDWISADGPLTTARLWSAFDAPLVLRYAGDVDVESLTSAGIGFFPENVPGGHMGVLPSAVGIDPVIRLQAGGLKSAEALLTGEHLLDGEPVVEVMA